MISELFSNSCGERNFSRDKRGSAYNVGYTITVGITAILIIGLVIGVGAVLDNQQDRAVTHQVDVIGDQVASGVMATDRLGGTGEATNATVTRNLPDEVVGTPYNVLLVERPDGDFLVVEALNRGYETQIPVDVDATVEDSIVQGGAELEIAHVVDDESGERVIRLQEEGKPPQGVEVEDDSYYAVTIENLYPNPAQEGDTITVETTVTNTGDEQGSQEVTLNIAGVGEVDSEVVELDPGEDKGIDFQWEDARKTMEFEIATVESDDATDARTFEVEEDEPEEGDPEITVQEFGISDKTDEESFEVPITVEEVNNGEAQDIELNLEVIDGDGQVVYDETVSIDNLQNEPETVTFGNDEGTPTLGEFEAQEDQYTATASVDTSNAGSDTESTSFRVEEDQDPPYFAVDVTDAPDSVTEDEEYVVDAQVTNTGDETGSDTIELIIGGEGTIDQETVTDLEGDDSQQVTLVWEAEDHTPGDYTGEVSSTDESESVSVTIEETGADRPEFSNVDVDDNSNDWPPGQSGVEYDVSYDVSDEEGIFEQVEIEFENQDNPVVDEEFTRTGVSDSASHSPPNNQTDFGDEYVITLRLYDVDGEVESERVVIEDIADGTPP